MTKEETVMTLREEYLAGKSAEKREEFFAKPLERQYSAIQTWKHRRDKAMRKPKPAAEHPADIASHLGAACKAVNSGADLSDASLAQIRSLVEELASLIGAELNRRRDAEIEELQRRQEEIAARLELLQNKGNVKSPWEDNLFGF